MIQCRIQDQYLGLILSCLYLVGQVCLHGAARADIDVPHADINVPCADTCIFVRLSCGNRSVHVLVYFFRISST